MSEEILRPEDAAPENADATPESETPSKPKRTRSALLAEQAALLEALQAELAQLQDTHARLLAEYANYKRRTEQEKQQLGAFIAGELLTTLLPTLDNFERAAESELGEAYRTGVEMAFGGLQKALAERGLEAIEPLGQPFDPEAHHAVLREEAAEGEDTDVVTQVLQKGYRLGERILRPAMVAVRS
jgi:molecular chaperone GrpE